MIEQQAQVTQVRNGEVWLSVRRQSGCQSCELKKGCGTGSLGRLFGLSEQVFRLPNQHNLKSGDRVIIAIPEKSYLLASLLIYLLPLLLMFLSGAIAESWWQIEWLTVLMTLAGLFIGLMLSAGLSKKKYAHTLQPRIIRQIW